MRRGTAARYCDLSEAEFEREVMAGNLPAPLILGRHEHWSRSQLDRALLVLAGEMPDMDWRDGSPLYDKAANG